MNHPLLTPAQNRVLALIMEGQTCKRIARETGRSHRTVENQATQIKLRLRAKTLIEAALCAERAERDEREQFMKNALRRAVSIIRELKDDHQERLPG